MKLWIGEIPDIFGYGIYATGETEAQCKAALKREFLKQKKLFNYTDSFTYAFEEDFGSRMALVEIGKAYFGGFGE